MTAKRLKKYLDPLVLAEDRDYTIRFVKKKPPGKHAFYKPNRITIYHAAGQSELKLLEASIHEISHHIVFKANGNWLLHGKEFSLALQHSLTAFNLIYQDKLGAYLVFNEKRLKTGPWFLKLIKKGV